MPKFGSRAAPFAPLPCAVLLVTVWPCASAHAQQFVLDNTQFPSGNPFNNSMTENVDFADLDQDGDWDSALADGGDVGPDQSRIWINLGHAQGGTIGFFRDETSTRCPTLQMQARDIEFVDFDNDTDVDLYISNTASTTAVSNHWWRNSGPASAGFYVDETSTRWVGLGQSGSSIPASLVLPSGGFIDWSCDCDFGDLDNDGDLDLVHSTYGDAFSGLVPTRIFLNDGNGLFAEFNPSGFQLTSAHIADGSPGLWSEGTQLANTTDATGATCDVASTPLDIDVADIDGDLDLDILHGSRQESPRMFQNRMEENGGVFSPLRDVTGTAFPPGSSSGMGHYEQEFGDFDADGDVDIYGLNWVIPTPSQMDDITLTNNGDGTYCCIAFVPNSSVDDNEADFFDCDNDGDLDVVLTTKRLYVNSDGAGAWNAPIILPGMGGTIDFDAADVDSDGDYDLHAANLQGDHFYENLAAADDTFAPRLYRLEQAPDRAPGPDPTVVRVQVYDNASYYTTWYNATHLEVHVDGGAAQLFPMQSSQGQIFRGEIPGNLAGVITYRAVSGDEYGNTGASAFAAYTAGTPVGTSYCFGDGSLATACPCQPPRVVPNPSGAFGHGCANSFDPNGAHLLAGGTTTPDTLAFTCEVAPNYAGLAFLVKGDASTPGGIAAGDGVRCASGALVRFGGHNAGSNGAPLGLWTYPNTAQTFAVSVATAQAPAQSAHYQLFYRNATAAFCSAATTNFSNAIRVDWP